MRATWASWHPERGFHNIYIDVIEGLDAKSMNSAQFRALQDAATQEYLSNVTGWRALPVFVVMKEGEANDIEALKIEVTNYQITLGEARKIIRPFAEQKGYGKGKIADACSAACDFLNKIGWGKA